jgi:hypothetical protein
MKIAIVKKAQVSMHQRWCPWIVDQPAPPKN